MALNSIMEKNSSCMGNESLTRNVTAFSPDLSNMLLPEDGSVISIFAEIFLGKKKDPVADYLEAQELRIKLSKAPEMIWSYIRSGDVERVIF